MCFLICLLPMTGWLVIAYFVFFLAKRSDGMQRVLGRALGIWAIGIAVCFLFFGTLVQLMGVCPLERRVLRILSGQPAQTTYSAPAPTGPRRSF